MSGHRALPSHRWTAGEWKTEHEVVANESLVTIYVNERKITSLLASSDKLESLYRGHLATEYNCVLNDAITEFSIQRTNGSIDLHGTIPSFEHTLVREGIVTSSCGACDHEQLQTLIDSVPRVDEPEKELTMESLLEALAGMRNLQHGFQVTGGMHAAAISYYQALKPSLDLISEDIGRHNAVDKVIGSALSEGHFQRPAILFLSGRCGWDIVAKAARLNIPIIASIGAASDLAIQTARMANMTLVTFARDQKAVVYGRQEGRFKAKD